MRYNNYMNADKRTVADRAFEQISENVQKLTQDKSRDDLIDIIRDLMVERDLKNTQLFILRNAMYGSKSEGIQLSLFDEDGEPATSDEQIENQVQEFNENHIEELKLAKENIEKKIEAAEKISKKQALDSGRSDKKHKKAVRTNKVVVHEADKSETCPICHKRMVHAGWKIRKKYSYVPGYLEIIEEKFETITCPDKCTDENGKSVIKTVKPSEPDLIDKSPATESLVSSLVYQKYLLDLPLYRIEKDFRTNGIEYSRQSMCNVTQTCFEKYIRPVYERILSDFKKLSVVHLDETGLKCLELRDTHKTSAMVAGVSGPAEENRMVVYRFFEGKGQEFVRSMLGDEFSGAVMTDGLKAYENYSHSVHLNCMAHARRRFYEAVQVRDDFKAYKKLLTQEERILYLENHKALNILLSAMVSFGDLYRVEREYGNTSLKTLQAARREISLPAFNELEKTAEEVMNGFVGGSLAWKAGNYFCTRKESLGRYLEDGRYPIDNNAAEREIKVFVMARKNFLFSNSAAGAESAAGYLTLMQSAVENGLHPRKYLEHVLNTMKYYKEQEVPESVLKDLLPYSGVLPEELY